MGSTQALSRYEEMLREHIQLQQELTEVKQEEMQLFLEYTAILEAKVIDAGLDLPPSPTLTSTSAANAAIPLLNTAAAKKPAVRRREPRTPRMPEPIPQPRQKARKTGHCDETALKAITALESQGIKIIPEKAHESLALLVNLEEALTTGDIVFPDPHRLTPDILRIMKATSGLGWSLQDQIADAIWAAAIPDVFKSAHKKTEAEHVAIVFRTAEREHPFGLDEEDVEDCVWARNLGIDPEAAGYLRFMTEMDD